jgi:hypothetical protein
VASGLSREAVRFCARFKLCSFPASHYPQHFQPIRLHEPQDKHAQLALITQPGQHSKLVHAALQRDGPSDHFLARGGLRAARHIQG